MMILIILMLMMKKMMIMIMVADDDNDLSIIGPNTVAWSDVSKITPSFFYLTSSKNTYLKSTDGLENLAALFAHQLLRRLSISSESVRLVGTIGVPFVADSNVIQQRLMQHIGLGAVRQGADERLSNGFV